MVTSKILAICLLALTYLSISGMFFTQVNEYKAVWVLIYSRLLKVDTESVILDTT